MVRIDEPPERAGERESSETVAHHVVLHLRYEIADGALLGPDVTRARVKLCNKATVGRGVLRSVAAGYWKPVSVARNPTKKSAVGIKGALGKL